MKTLLALLREILASAAFAVLVLAVFCSVAAMVATTLSAALIVLALPGLGLLHLVGWL